MSNLLFLHLVLLVAIGAGMGLITRYYHPGPTPLDAAWSMISGVIGAAIVTLAGAYIGLYPLGGFMYYATAPTGALIGVMVYAVIITKDPDEDATTNTQANTRTDTSNNDNSDKPAE